MAVTMVEIPDLNIRLPDPNEEDVPAVLNPTANLPPVHVPVVIIDDDEVDIAVRAQISTVRLEVVLEVPVLPLSEDLVLSHGPLLPEPANVVVPDPPSRFLNRSVVVFGPDQTFSSVKGEVEVQVLPPVVIPDPSQVVAAADPRVEGVGKAVYKMCVRADESGSKLSLGGDVVQMANDFNLRPLDAVQFLMKGSVNYTRVLFTGARMFEESQDPELVNVLTSLKAHLARELFRLRKQVQQ